MRRKTSLSVAENVNRTLTDIARKMGGGKVQVGFLEGATYPDGTPVAAVAYWNEFGHGGNFPSPPRPFFRAMIAKESPSWPGKMAALAKAYNFDGQKVLAIMGEDIAGALRESIIDTNSPALSPTSLVLRARFWGHPSDIRVRDVLSAQEAVAKGNAGASGTQAKPLVWTGHMLASVGFEVKR
jgi:hypothetical protein